MSDLLKAATELLNRLEADKEVIEKGRWKGERDNLAECIIKEREKMKIYQIEMKAEAYNITGVVEFDYKYRYVSLYNGARGFWFDNKEDAEEQGEKHQDIIGMITGGYQIMTSK